MKTLFTQAAIATQIFFGATFLLMVQNDIQLGFGLVLLTSGVLNAATKWRE
jgi:hypothetical protein